MPHITHPGPAYRGMRLVKLPTIRSKHLDTIAHTLLSSLHALGRRYDIALYFNVGNSPVTWIPRIAGQRVVLNVDGLDWKRKKWGRFARWYIRSLRATADPRVIFTGYLFGEGYRELLSNAYCFVETSEVGGTHPALLEAMAAGSCVVVNDTPENLETTGDAGFSYPGEMGAAGLRTVLEGLLKDPALTAQHGARGLERVRARYSWAAVTDAYERLFRELTGEVR